MKKNIFYISIMSCMFCLTLSTIVYASAFTDSLINYCVPKPGNNCSAASERATYTNRGCSCPIYRYYNTTERKCVVCPAGSIKTYEGVGDCTLCPIGTYWREI